MTTTQRQQQRKTSICHYFIFLSMKIKFILIKN